MSRLVVEYIGKDSILTGERVPLALFADYYERTPWRGNLVDWRIVDDEAEDEA